MENNEIPVIGLGHKQEATPERQIAADRSFNQDYEFAARAKEHLWVVMVTHRATDQMINAFVNEDPSDMPMLDVDTLAMPPRILCWVCSEPFTPRLRMRRCKGEPR